MTRKQKNTLYLVLVGIAVLFAFLVALVPQLTLTAKQIADNGWIFKTHEFFTDVKLNIETNYILYLIVIFGLMVLYFFNKKKR